MDPFVPAGRNASRPQGNPARGADPIRGADVASWTETIRAQRAAARDVARLVADTLRAQFLGAAYLVLCIDHYRELDTDLFPASIRDAEGTILTDFESAELPPLPAGDELRALWSGHDPADAFQVRHVLRTLRVSGAAFDDFPEDLRIEGDADGYIPCLLLSSQARPEWWEYGDEDYRERLLRPYSAPQPPAETVCLMR
ncbi:hypothetical protein ACWC1D_25685 [Streptomyces sp. NPDC001478]